MGSFPALIAGPAKNKNLYYSLYLQTYLQRDVRNLTQVGSVISFFLKFPSACVSRKKTMLNLSDISNDTDITIPTAKNWFSIHQVSFHVYLV
jgi:predicted AAA+ superfamily ATPase